MGVDYISLRHGVFRTLNAAMASVYKELFPEGNGCYVLEDRHPPGRVDEFGLKFYDDEIDLGRIGHVDLGSGMYNIERDKFKKHGVNGVEEGVKLLETLGFKTREQLLETLSES